MSVIAIRSTGMAPIAITILGNAGPRGPQGLSIKGDKGDKGDQGEPGIAETYTHLQGVPATHWTISHGLDRYPSVTVTDSTGAVVETEISYPDRNTVIVAATAPFSGQAFLN